MTLSRIGFPPRPSSKEPPTNASGALSLLVVGMGAWARNVAENDTTTAAHTILSANLLGFAVMNGGAARSARYFASGISVTFT